MSRTSCIQHKPKSPLVILHQDYIDICNGDKPAAILLKILEYWTDVKISMGKQSKIENQIRDKEGLSLLSEDLWIYKTHKHFVEDSLGLLKDYQIRKGLKILFDKKFISKRNNPKYNWDRTLQYLLNVNVVQESLNNDSIRHPQRMEGSPITDGTLTGNEAITETTTEITTDIKSNTSFGKSPLEDLVNGQDTTKPTTGDNPTDQWFEYSDKFIKMFSNKTGRYPNVDEKAIISEVADAKEADLTLWEKTLTECNLNWTGAARWPVTRAIEVYQAGGNWQQWIDKKYNEDDNPTPTNTLTEEQKTRLAQLQAV